MKNGSTRKKAQRHTIIKPNSHSKDFSFQLVLYSSVLMEISSANPRPGCQYIGIPVIEIDTMFRQSNSNGI